MDDDRSQKAVDGSEDGSKVSTSVTVPFPAVGWTEWSANERKHKCDRSRDATPT